MIDYTRPAIETREFRDEFGDVIRYGTRWTGPPPEDSYSRVSNPERFSPLHTVADALIEHLRAAHPVGVASRPAQAATSTSVGTAADTRVVALTPERADAAPLVFRFTDFPGVRIEAGVRHRAAFPACGCDACDETWEEAAEDMEGLVLAVADGTFTETIILPTDGKATVQYGIRRAGGGGRSGATYDLEPDSGLRDDAARLAGLPGGRWQPWGRRSEVQSAGSI